MSSRSRKRTGWKQSWQLHAERARAQGIPLSQYCQERNLSVQSLYSARYQFSKSQRQSGAAVKKQNPLGKFVEVQVSPAEPTPASMACRVRVKGCVIECATLPPTSWLASLISGDTDAVA